MTRYERRGRPAPFWASLGSEGQQGAGFHRESDRRLRRAMGVAMLCSSLLVGVLLGVVGLKVQQVRLSYRLDGLRTTRSQLEEANRRLSVELATLASPARIESKARADLGMVRPDRQQVQLAREFVAGDRGLGAHEPRTASTARLAPATPGPR